MVDTPSHPHTFLKNIHQISLTKISGEFFRLVSAKHKDNILNAEASLAHGGRYNPAHEFGVLYLGETEEICKAERRRKIQDEFLITQVFGKVHVESSKVLDLTKSENLEKFGIKKEDLLIEESQEGYALTWDIARMAYNLGIEAILVPSMTGLGKNLIIFDKYIRDRTKLIFIHEE